MAPTESSILTNFLLAPAPLHAAISKDDFTALFPRAQQSSEDIDVLYDEFSRQIAQGIEEVKAHIAAEVQRGAKQQKLIVKARRKTHQSQIDALDLQDIQMDMEMRDGENKDLKLSEPHTQKTILPAIEAACEEVEQQISAIEAETAEVLDDLRETVGNLSDLRYGTLPKVAGTDKSVAEESIEALRRLEDVARNTKTIDG